MRHFLLPAALLASLCLPARADYPATIAAVKPSVVGIATYMRLRSPAIRFEATGFAVGDGRSIITNAHGVQKILDTENQESLGIAIQNGDAVEFRPATVEAVDSEHDLAHLRIAGAPLPALRLGAATALAEGAELAFTGYPLGMVLGLHPVSHRAYLAALTPIVMPALVSRQLGARAIAQLQRKPLLVYQLDGTAYPGNSGSPVYDPDSGAVLGVINAGFVKGLKETAISEPSGITYAIPVRHVHELLHGKATAK